jgi:hypothetical protein
MIVGQIIEDLVLDPDLEIDDPELEVNGLVVVLEVIVLEGVPTAILVGSELRVPP